MDNRLPIVEGGRPRPPRWIGVEKKRGWIARKDISTKDKKA